MMRRALFALRRQNISLTTKAPLSAAAITTAKHLSPRETPVKNNLATLQRNFSTNKSHDEFTEEAKKAKRKSEEDRKIADEEEELKMKILDAALTKVPELGWTSGALHAGAEQAGFQSVTAGLINNGPVELIRRHMEVCDAKLEDIMLKEVEAKKKEGDRVRVRPFCRKMVEQRLRMNADLVKCGRWAEAVAVMAKPDSFPGYLEVELRLMDAIWHHCDLSPTNDINWYTKRISLAVMYKVRFYINFTLQ